MRKIVAAEYVTLDGAMTDLGGEGEIEYGCSSRATSTGVAARICQPAEE